MEVILLKEVRGRGGEGDVINVSRGFANNFLLTQGYAVKATPGNLKQLEQRRKNIEKREEIRVSDANSLAEKLEGATVRIKAQVGDEGQLFGSVTAPMIADAINEQFGLDVDRRRIELGKPIKQIGEYSVPVGFYRDIKATVKVVVSGDTLQDEVAQTEAAEDAVADAIEQEVVETAEEALAEEIKDEVVETALENEAVEIAEEAEKAE